MLLPALSTSFLPQRLQRHAERVGTVALPEPGSPGAHASVPRCPLCPTLPPLSHAVPAQAEVVQALFWSQKGQGDHSSGRSRGGPPAILVPNPSGWSWEGNVLEIEVALGQAWNQHSKQPFSTQRNKERGGRKVQVGQGLAGRSFIKISPARDWQLVERWKGVSLSLLCGSVISSQLGDSSTACDGLEEEGGTPASWKKGDR